MCPRPLKTRYLLEMPQLSSDFVLGPIRMPKVVAFMIAAIGITSIAAAVLGRNAGWPLTGLLYLSPQHVVQGQVWRLVTWPLLESDPIGLLFGGYTLFWVGRDLVATWGQQRFALRTLTLTLLIAAVTTALAFVWAGLGAAGVWPVLCGLLVMWGITFRNRSINLYGLLPLSGIRLAQITVGLTALYAVFSGIATFLPHFAAEGIAYVWMVPLAKWQRGRKPSKTTKSQGPGQVFSFSDWYDEHNKDKKN